MRCQKCPLCSAATAMYHAPQAARDGSWATSAETCPVCGRFGQKESLMRMLLNITLPHAEFNAAVRDGSVGQKLNRILDDAKPEAVYFTEQNGHRGLVMVVNLADPSKIPALAEPWFLVFNADVQFRIAMTPDDLKKAGLEPLGKKWGGA
jgi:hypothetical protein